MEQEKVQNNENNVQTSAKVQDKKATEFKFFKNCSASLKKFSLLIFVINLFFIVSLTIVALVMLPIYTSFQVLSILALPIATVVAIAVLVARFISAVIYGFAEIVEKNEKNL